MARSLLSLMRFTPKASCKVSSLTGVFRRALASSHHSPCALGQHVFVELEREREDIIHAHAISPSFNAIPKEHQKKKKTQTNTNTYTHLLTPYHTAPCCLHARSLSSQVWFPTGMPRALPPLGVPPCFPPCLLGGIVPWVPAAASPMGRGVLK